MHLKSCPHFLDILHLKSALFPFEWLNPISEDKFAQFPLMHNLAHFVYFSTNHEFISLWVLLLLQIDVIVQKQEFLHNYFGVEDVEVVFEIVLYENFEF
jgi:hypothetical protein